MQKKGTFSSDDGDDDPIRRSKSEHTNRLFSLHSCVSRNASMDLNHI